MRHYILLIAILLFPFLAGAAGEGTGEVSWPDGLTIQANVPIDADGDGLDDYILCGDYDGDGTLEMTDIVACQAALTDTGGIYIYVMPGSYAAPAAAITGQDRAFLELDDNTTLECAGTNQTILYGAHWIDGANGTSVSRAIVGNSTANDDKNITVRNCQLDGDWPSGWDWDVADVNTGTDVITLQADASDGDHGYQTADGPFRLVDGGGGLPTGLSAAVDYWVIRTSATEIQLAITAANATAGTQIDITGTGGASNTIGPDWVTEGITRASQMGFYFRGIENLTLEGNYVHNSFHSGFYVSNANGVSILDNYGDQLGGFGDITAGGMQAGLYLFSTGVAMTENVLVSGNRIDRVGGGSYNTRINDISAGDDMSNIAFLNNSAWRTNICINLQSVRDVSVVGFQCSDSGVLMQTLNTLTGYRDQGAQSDATQRITFKDITGTNLTSTTTKAITIGEYHDGIYMSNVVVDGVVDSCMGLEQPFRGFYAENITLKKCSGHGIVVTGVATTSSEAIHFKNLTIDSVDGDPSDGAGTSKSSIQVNGAGDFLDIDGFYANGFTKSALRLISGGSNMSIKNARIICEPPQYVGRFTEAQAVSYVCNSGTSNNSLLISNASSSSDCTFASGTGAQQSICRCDGDDTWTALILGTTISDQDAILAQGVVDDSEFLNIRGENCGDKYTFANTAVTTDTIFSNISARHDTTFFTAAGDNPMAGAINVSVASSGNITIDMKNVSCVGTDAACVLLDTDHADLSASSHYISAAGCAVACTDGALCTDTDGGAGATFFVCGDGGAGTYAAP